MPGSLIRDVRLFMGWTQQELATELGKSKRTIVGWESKGAHRDVRYTLMGLLVSYGKPIGILWPER